MSTIAIDIGAGWLAAVEMKLSKGRLAVRRTAVEPIDAGLVVGGEVADKEALAGALRGFWKRAGFRGRQVRLGVANRNVLVRMIDMPAIDDPERRAAAVEQAVTEHLPIAAAEAVVDSQPVGRYWTGTESRERRMVVAAQRTMIDDLVGAVRAAGLQPTGIDLEAFALLRALLPAPSVIDEGSADAPSHAVCHIGTDITQVVVAVDRNCHFTRVIDAGALQLVRGVSEATGLDAHEAETAMGACGFAGPPAEGWDAAAASVRAALVQAARPLVGDIARSLDFYRGQQDARPIERMILAGPGALLPEFDGHLAAELNLSVEFGDPRGRIDAPGGLDLTTAARAAVAIGLALDGPERR